MCTTRCWLFEVLWLFPRLLGASGPTAGGFYRPSGLGTGSGSWDKEGEGKSFFSATFQRSCVFRSLNSYGDIRDL